MRGHNTAGLLAIIFALAGALGIPGAVAQAPAPAVGQGTAVSPTTAGTEQTKGTTAGTEQPKGVSATKPRGACNTIDKPAAAGGASIVHATGESLQHKNWQALGGDIQFTIKSFDRIPSDASVYVCFRWKLTADEKRDYIETRPSRLDLDGDGMRLRVTTTIPNDLGAQPAGIATALPLVPLAEVRILAIKQDKAVADVTTAIGITHPFAAAAFAIAAITLGFVVLYGATAWRIKHTGINKANWFLRIISTPSGYASLSQLQIVLWTFVVAASAVYVMSLSGQLVEITNGTLVLLGIAGAAGLAAKAHNETQNASAQAAATAASAENAKAAISAAEKQAAAKAAAAAPAADPVAAARVAAENAAAQEQAAEKKKLATEAKKKADNLTNPPDDQVPRWSDLIVNESVKDDGTTTREVDVARFQMLMFTIITATFVLMNVITTYVIPEISTGFLTLMGISNGVYVGSKIAQRT